jgi:hypothetical protein
MREKRCLYPKLVAFSDCSPDVILSSPTPVQSIWHTLLVYRCSSHVICLPLTRMSALEDTVGINDTFADLIIILLTPIVYYCHTGCNCGYRSKKRVEHQHCTICSPRTLEIAVHTIVIDYRQPYRIIWDHSHIEGMCCCQWVVNPKSMVA